MEFGIGLLGYHGSWDDAAFAEQHGFATAGFVDSPLIAGDPWVCLGLAARATERIRIGTLLTIPGLRSAPTTAAAIATVNRLAPGRTFLGIGTGHTSRDGLGRGPVPAKQLRAFVTECRALLDGEPALHGPTGHQRPIRFRHRGSAAVDTEHRVPIIVGADGPKTLAIAGELGDGFVATLKASAAMGNAPEVFATLLATARAAADNAGRPLDDTETMWSTATCVLEPGESAASPRVLARVGPAAMMAYHSYACHPEIADHLPPPIRDRIDIYEREVLDRFDVPRELVYQEVNAGHLSHLLDGEAAVLTDEIVRLMTLTGTAQEIADQILRMEQAGLKNLTLWAGPATIREMILSVEERLMPLLMAAAAA